MNSASRCCCGHLKLSVILLNTSIHYKEDILYCHSEVFRESVSLTVDFDFVDKTPAHIRMATIMPTSNKTLAIPIRAYPPVTIPDDLQLK